MTRLLSVAVTFAILLFGSGRAFAQPCGCGCGMNYSQCEREMGGCPELARWKQQNPQPKPPPTTQVAAQWRGSRPPVAVSAAINNAIKNPAIPKGLRDVFATGNVRLTYRNDVPRNLAYSIWFSKDNTLAVGPAFQDLSDKAQSQLLAFEFGKLIQRAHDTDLAFRSTLGKYSLPADLRTLPDVPTLTDDDYPSVVGYAYYRYLHDRQTLIDRGYGGLVEAWDKNPPHAVLK